MRQEPPPADDPCIGDWQGFHAELRRAAVAATQTGTPMSLLMLEIASQAPSRRGDIGLPLDALARVARSAVGRHSALARYAEERLAVIMGDTDLADAVARAERIGQELWSSSAASSEVGDPLPIVPAIGVAQFRDDESLNDLIQRAGEALDRAKADRILVAAAEQRLRRRPTRLLCGAGQLTCLCGLCGQ